MRKTTLFASLFFVGLWVIFALYLTGAYQPEWLPSNIKVLSRPKSTAELGDSFAMLDGLFSSIAVVLGLIAILLQGRELRAATQAQTNQVIALTLQIKEQESSNKLSAYAARLQYLIAEMERLDSQIDKLRKEAEVLPSGDAKSEKWEIIKNSRGLHGAYKKQAKDIDQKIQELLR